MPPRAAAAGRRGGQARAKGDGRGARPRAAAPTDGGQDGRRQASRPPGGPRRRRPVQKRGPPPSQHAVGAWRTRCSPSPARTRPRVPPATGDGKDDGDSNSDGTRPTTPPARTCMVADGRRRVAGGGGATGRPTSYPLPLLSSPRPGPPPPSLLVVPTGVSLAAATTSVETHVLRVSGAGDGAPPGARPPPFEDGAPPRRAPGGTPVDRVYMRYHPGACPALHHVLDDTPHRTGGRRTGGAVYSPQQGRAAQYVHTIRRPRRGWQTWSFTDSLL